VRRHRKAALLALLVAAAATGCRHTAETPAALPADWRSLVKGPTPFAALYRLSFGSERNLVLTVRSGAGLLSLSVAVPPGGAALSAWVAGAEGWVERVKERCREPLPPGVIPLPKDAFLPLDADLAALLLSGLLPEGAHEVPEAPGWVEAATERVVWRARIEGSPAVCTRVVLGSPDGRTLLAAELKAPVGHVPGAIALVAGAQRAEMVLQEWHLSEPPGPPVWLAFAKCGAAR